MAVHFNARVYGEINGATPFLDASGNSAFTRVKDYPKGQMVNFPTNNTTIWPLPNGILVGNPGFYCYSVIEVAAAGLNVHSQKFASDSSASSLGTTIG